LSFVKLALPLVLGFLKIVMTLGHGHHPGIGLIWSCVCIGAVLAGFLMPELYVKNVATKRRDILNYLLPEGPRPADDLRRGGSQHRFGLSPRLARDADHHARVGRRVRDDRDRAHLPSRIASRRWRTWPNAPIHRPSRRSSMRCARPRSTAPPLAASLRILSQEFRQTRASKAEEKGARMPALMTVPLMVFILPTLITVLIAPALMSALALT
jgi:tight adherence protein C